MSKFRDLFTNIKQIKQILTKNNIDWQSCLVRDVCFGTLIFAILIFGVLFLRPQHIGVVNITGIVDEFIKTQAKNNLSPEELKKRVQVFGTDLEKVLYQIGVKKHAVLMPAEAVITGAKDYTREVQRQLSRSAHLFHDTKNLVDKQQESIGEIKREKQAKQEKQEKQENQINQPVVDSELSQELSSMEQDSI